MSKVLRIGTRSSASIVDDLRRRRIAVDGLLKEVGLHRADLTNPEERVPYVSVLALIERAASLARDASYGLRVGASRDARSAGLLGFVMLNSSTLMDALVNLQRYVKVIGEGEEFEIERSGPQVALRFRETDMALRGLRHNSDYIAAAVVRMCRDITRQRVCPVRAEFICGRPNARVDYADFLGCPIKFHAPWDALIFSIETTRLPVRGADDKLLRELELACQRILGPAPRKPNLVHDVRQLIIEKLPRGSANADDIAGELNLSVKTLQRRLAKHGQSFGSLLDQTRCETIKHYLTETDMRLAQLAYLAGYSEPATLVRAFKRWTGSTPMQFRERDVAARQV